jgi:hypothetical protein
MAGPRVSEYPFVLEVNTHPVEMMPNFSKEHHPLVWMMGLISHSGVLYAAKICMKPER